MKKFIYGISFLALIGTIIFGCQKDRLSPLKEMLTTDVDDFFENVSKMNLEVSKENVIYINYEWNKVKNEISIISVKEQEPDFFILESTKDQTSRGSSYIVKCSNGKKVGQRIVMENGHVEG